jgi:membrane protein implicated in regulation of membrane protease activity
MDTVGKASFVAILAYCLYEGVTWIYARKHPPQPYKDEDPVLGRVAIVRREFLGAESSLVKTGVVELNGATWQAETASTERSLKVGDRCKVRGRDGLRLLVEPVS